MRYADAARRIVDGCCEHHPTGALTLSEIASQVGDEEIKAFFVEEENVRLRSNRLANLLRAVRELLEDYLERRLAPPLTESEIAAGSFIYSYQDDEANDLAERLAVARYRQQLNMRRLLTEMDDTAFESLCGKIIDAVGCIGVTVTKASKDKGIDFIGRLPLRMAVVTGEGPSLPAFVRLVGGVSFMVFGQAKRYGDINTVGREPVAQLHGDWKQLVNEFSNNTIDSVRLRAMTRAGFKVADPVLLVFITSSRFTKGAMTTAAELGIVTLDGEQVAQLLTESLIGMEQVGDAEWTTSMELLEAACL